MMTIKYNNLTRLFLAHMISNPDIPEQNYDGYLQSLIEYHPEPDKVAQIIRTYFPN